MLFANKSPFFLTATTCNCIDKYQAFAVEVKFEKDKICPSLKFKFSAFRNIFTQQHDLLELQISLFLMKTLTYKVFALNFGGCLQLLMSLSSLKTFYCFRSSNVSDEKNSWEDVINPLIPGDNKKVTHT